MNLISHLRLGSLELHSLMMRGVIGMRRFSTRYSRKPRTNRMTPDQKIIARRRYVKAWRKRNPELARKRVREATRRWRERKAMGVLISNPW